MIKIGEKIKTYLKEKKIEQKHLAAMIGISPASLGRSLNSNSIKIDTVEKISEALKLDITYWFKESNSKEYQINDIAPCIAAEPRAKLYTKDDLSINDLVRITIESQRRILKLEKELLILKKRL